MKSVLLVFSFLVSQAQAAALSEDQALQAMANLIPVGGNQVMMSGKTAKGDSCRVELSNGSLGMGAYYMEAAAKKYHKFQTSLGRQFVQATARTGELKVVYKKTADTIAETEYLETLTVKRTADKILSISIKDVKGEGTCKF
jgi:hypothetical protein